VSSPRTSRVFSTLSSPAVMHAHTILLLYTVATYHNTVATLYPALRRFRDVFFSTARRTRFFDANRAVYRGRTYIGRYIVVTDTATVRRCSIIVLYARLHSTSWFSNLLVRSGSSKYLYDNTISNRRNDKTYCFAFERPLLEPTECHDNNNNNNDGVAKTTGDLSVIIPIYNARIIIYEVLWYYATAAAAPGGPPTAIILIGRACIRRRDRACSGRWCTRGRFQFIICLGLPG